MQKPIQSLSLIILLSLALSSLCLAAPMPGIQRYYSCQLLLKHLVVIKDSKTNTCIWQPFAVGGSANEQQQTTPMMMYGLQFQGNKKTNCKPVAEGGVVKSHVFGTPPYDVGYECQFEINNMSRPEISASNSSGFLGAKCTLNSDQTLITCTGNPTL